MSAENEIKIRSIEKSDIVVPRLKEGGSAIVFQRHERYERDTDAKNAGSLVPNVIEGAKQRDKDFFEELLRHDETDGEIMVLFVASDTQYAGNGYRSMETAQVAQDAAVEVMAGHGVDSTERIINFNPSFKTDMFAPKDKHIRPDAKIREPQFFDSDEYASYLVDKYGGLNSEALGAHEMDAEKEMREALGVDEGVYEVLDRTKRSIAIMERYSRVFHANNPGKRLIIWAASHYDTISPLVKDATDTNFEHYVPVDYAGGIVIEIDDNQDREPTFTAQAQKVVLKLGKKAVTAGE